MVNNISSELPQGMFYVIYRWTINTKYYTADVSLWMTHLSDDFSVRNLPISHQLTALVMVFDMNDVSILLLTLVFLNVAM